jgi:hypothetical protein
MIIDKQEEMGRNQGKGVACVNREEGQRTGKESEQVSTRLLLYSAIRKTPPKPGRKQEHKHNKFVVIQGCGVTTAEFNKDFFLSNDEMGVRSERVIHIRCCHVSRYRILMHTVIRSFTRVVSLLFFHERKV